MELSSMKGWTFVISRGGESTEVTSALDGRIRIGNVALKFMVRELLEIMN
jgi:hypothetical protein